MSGLFRPDGLTEGERGIGKAAAAPVSRGPPGLWFVVGKVRVDGRRFIHASPAAFTSRPPSKLGDAANGRRFDRKFSPGALFCIMRKHRDRDYRRLRCV
jgi:hypothetical protein